MMKRRTRWLWVERIVLLQSPLFYVVIFTLFFIPSYFSLDPDFGWHIMAGKTVFLHGIPAHDLFTYTAPNFPWILHEWLSDVINYIVYTFLGGYTTLAVMYAGLWTFAVGLASRRLPAKLRLVAVMTTAALLPYSGVRAITWTAVWFMVLVAVQKSERWQKRWWLSPLIILVWANMHGSFVLGLLYLAWQCVRRPVSRRSVLVLVISAAITLVNPYGIALYREVFATLGDSSLHSRIEEWSSLALTIMTGAVTGVFIGFLAIQKGSWRKKVFRFDTILFLMALSSVRHTVPFVLYLLTSIADVSRDALAQLPKKVIHGKGARKLVVVSVLTAWVFIVIFTAMAVCPIRQREASYPQQIAANLRAHPCPGNVFAYYNYGGYLIWRVPGEKVYIDGRMPSWQYNGTSYYMNNYLKVLKDTTYQKAQFAHYNVQCVVWDKNSDFAKRLIKQGWKIVQREPTNTIVLLVIQ